MRTPGWRIVGVMALLLGTLRPSAAGAQGVNSGTGVDSADADAGRSTPVAVARLDGEIRLDGVVDEPAWDAAAPLPMTMFTPTFRGEMTEGTDIRLVHDDVYLYVSARLYDSDPSQIRTNTFYRDQYSGDDIVAIVIDSYNDYETAVWFVANPAGARQDRTVANDADFSAGMPMNADWNSHWDVETTQTEEGWFAEFRIPFSTLGFQATGDEVTMGLIAYRFIPRKNERQLFPAIDPAWGGLAFAKPSQAQRVTLEGVRQTTPIYVTPYALGGFTQSPRLLEVGDWTTESDGTTEAGLDLKVSPTSNLSLDLTVNTDFAQVEADDQQINLTRFALFFPEKRQFFQERASTFNFNTGGFVNRLFHSRRIGLDDGQIVRIYGGARAVGRLGGMDFGLLTMQTAGVDGAPGENMGVLRLQQQILNPYSSVGGMLTSRLGSGSRNNVAYGLDADIRLFGDDYVTLKWAQTFDEQIGEADALDAGLILARWQRRRDDGVSYSAQYGRVGDDYRPGLGFQARRDYSLYGGFLQFKRFLGASSALRSVAVGAESEHFYRNEDATAESRAVSPSVEAEFKNGVQITLGGNAIYESVRSAFTISDVEVPAGDYWFHEGQLRFMLPRSWLFRGEYTVTAGSFYDGNRVGMGLNPAWNVSRHLELGGGYEVNRLSFPDRDVATTAQLVRLRVQVALDTRLSMSTLVQYNSAADLTSFNARFRYHFREGTDLWLVYNEGLNTNRVDTGLNPRLPLSAGRTLMVKYSHALIL